MDSAVAGLYKQTSLRRKNFVQTNFHVLLPLVGEDACAVKEIEIPVQTLSALMRCMAGAFIWPEEASKMKYPEFVMNCDMLVKNLEDNAWEADELECCRARLMASARNFVSGGARPFKKKKKELEFHVVNLKLRVQVSTVHEDREW